MSLNDLRFDFSVFMEKLRKCSASYANSTNPTDYLFIY